MTVGLNTQAKSYEKINVGFSFCLELNYNSKNVVTGSSLVVNCSRYTFACIQSSIKIFFKICPGDLSGSESFSISLCC